MNASLTIVVPAWKVEFLESALDSIGNQTDRCFSVLVVDDAGDPGIGSIVSKRPEYRYFRFSSNLGAKNLAAHLNRCMELVDTEWIWCFSDDDVMDPDCVARFRDALDRYPDVDVFQFTLLQQDQSLARTLKENHALAWESAADYLRSRLWGRRVSALPEHVFRRSAFLERLGGFPEFPLAWNSDDAAWLALATPNGIVGIPDAAVRWRQSSGNISSSTTNLSEKCLADRLYLDWIRSRGVVKMGRIAGAFWLAYRWSRKYRIGWGVALAESRKMPPGQGLAAFLAFCCLSLLGLGWDSARMVLPSSRG